MSHSTLNFHIARDQGLEFVFSSGAALTYPTHTHVSTFTVTLVRRSLVSVLRPAGRREYGPGSVYIDAPHEPHSPAYGDNYDIVSLCVDKQGVAEAGEKPLAGLFLGYAGALADQGLLSPEDVAALLGGLRQVLSRQPDALKEVGDPVSGLIGGLDPELAAPEFFMTGDDFSFLRRFKKVAGLTPHQFLVQNRLRTAKKLLADKLPPAAAALEAGFYDQSHLNRWFRRNIGLTPREYKNSCHFLD